MSIQLPSTNGPQRVPLRDFELTAAPPVPSALSIPSVLTVLLALAALALTMIVPAGHEIADHLSAAKSLGVARWAYGLLMLTFVAGACALYLWQAPDWVSVFAVAVLELALAMLLAFVFGLLVVGRTEQTLIRWMDLHEATRSDLARLWCFFAMSLAGGAALLTGRHSLAWRKRCL